MVTVSLRRCCASSQTGACVQVNERSTPSPWGDLQGEISGSFYLTPFIRLLCDGAGATTPGVANAITPGVAGATTPPPAQNGQQPDLRTPRQNGQVSKMATPHFV